MTELENDPSAPGSAPFFFCGCCGGLVPEDSPALLAPPDAVMCGKCGGPAAPSVPGAPTIPQHDPYGRYQDPRQWPLCALCVVVGTGAFADAASLADVLACRAPKAPGLPVLAFALACERSGDPESFPQTGWVDFAQRMPGFGAYCQAQPQASVRDRPGARWAHVSDQVVWAVCADLERVQAARAEVAHPSGRPCCVCGERLGPPRRWRLDTLLGGPVCGRCEDRARGRGARGVPHGVAQARARLSAPAPGLEPAGVWLL